MTGLKLVLDIPCSLSSQDTQPVLILNGDDVRRALPMKKAIEAMREAFAALSSGQADVPQRVHMPVEAHAGTTLVMPALVRAADPNDEALTVKVVSVFSNNAARGLARIQAAVLAIDPGTGVPIAVLEGAAITAIRTAAASGLATDLLARQDSRGLAVFGGGVQARTHIEAVSAVRPIESVAVFSRSPARAEQLVAEFSDQSNIRASFRVAPTPADALADADIVCATTTSAEPVFDDSAIESGTHINAVGSYTPAAREIPAETVARAIVTVDSRAAAWEEAGDLIQPFEAGLIGREHIHAELGELVLGTKSGRTDDRAITLFKSVGIAVQDALAARYAIAMARQLGLGQQVAW